MTTERYIFSSPSFFLRFNHTGKLGDPTKAASEAAKHASEFSRSMWEEVKHEAAELARKQHAGKK